MEIIKDYWAVIGSISLILWHMITQYFAFLKYKERLNVNEEKTIANEKSIIELKGFMANEISRISLEAEKADKEILVRVLDQEKNNNANSNAWAKVFGEIEKQLSNINLKLDTQVEDMKRLFGRVESIEKDRLDELKKKVDKLS